MHVILIDGINQVFFILIDEIKCFERKYPIVYSVFHQVGSMLSGAGAPPSTVYLYVLVSYITTVYNMYTIIII